jgi:hypothetical protein
VHWWYMGLSMSALRGKRVDWVTPVDLVPLSVCLRQVARIAVEGVPPWLFQKLDQPVPCRGLQFFRLDRGIVV